MWYTVYSDGQKVVRPRPEWPDRLQLTSFLSQRVCKHFCTHLQTSLAPLSPITRTHCIRSIHSNVRTPSCWNVFMKQSKPLQYLRGFSPDPCVCIRHYTWGKNSIHTCVQTLGEQLSTFTVSNGWQQMTLKTPTRVKAHASTK